MLGQKWVTLSLTGLMALATLFALLAVFSPWATDGDTDIRATGYGMDGISDIRDKSTVTANLGNEGFDDMDGIGLARAGSVLGIMGLCFFAIAFIAYENQAVGAPAWLGLVGLGAGALGFLLWLVALILFPIGASNLAEAATGGFIKPDLKWGAGLTFGILAGVFSLGAVAWAGVQTAMANGFRLELADGATANFD